MEKICCINWVKVKMPKVTLTVHLTLSGPEGRNDWQRDDQSAYNRPQIYIVMYKQLFIHTASSFINVLLHQEGKMFLAPIHSSEHCRGG